MKRFGLLVLLSILTFSISPCRAEIPKLINYQGMLTDAGGTPLNGPQNLIFRIYDDTTGGGTLQWSETRNGVPVDHGLFNVVLGQSAALNLAFDKSYWLEVEVQGEIMPRIRITSVGYAYRSSIADSALTTTPGSGSNWSVGDSVLYTNKFWGIARGGAGNEISGYRPHTQVNLGVNCTTSVFGDPGYPEGATISGGSGNRTTDGHATISGGYSNRATESCATVGGGQTNNAGGAYAVVGGGRVNEAGDYAATVSGGEGNVANGSRATVGGGQINTAHGAYATISGGYSNEAAGQSATISGGYSNEAPGKWAAVPGGYDNTAQGNFSFACGYKARADHSGCFVWADSTGGDFASTGTNQFLVRASGGVGIGTPNPSNETKLHVQATSDDFGVLVDAAGTSGTEIGLHTATSQYASLAKNTYFDAGGWQRFNTGQGAYLQEVRPDGEVWFRVADAGANPISWTNALTIENNGEVGIGTTNPGTKLAVAGLTGTTSYNLVRVNTTTGDFYFDGSSERYKQDIRPLRAEFNKILQAEPKSYIDRASGQRDIGYVAEEFDQLGLGDLVVYRDDGEPDGVKYERVSLYLLEVVKELKAKNRELEARVEALERR
jgi:hypothetical protein